MNKSNLRKTGAADTTGYCNDMELWNSISSLGTHALIVKLTLLNNGNSIRQ